MTDQSSRPVDPPGGPWTSHGHPIAGITVHGSGRPPVARCGGPGMCTRCATDAEKIRQAATRPVPPARSDDVAQLSPPSPHLRDDDVVAMDLHAKWHCESGNLLGAEDCGYDRCEIYAFARDAVAPLADRQLAGLVGQQVGDRLEALALGRFSRTSSTGAELVAAERTRQIDVEGWTPEHDARHAGEGLALAACCYALPPQMRKYQSRLADGHGDDRGDRYRAVPTLWPWHPDDWKPTTPEDRVRELVKAGALIAAEIDRLQARAALDA